MHWRDLSGFIKSTINAVQFQDINLNNRVTSFATDPVVLDFDPVQRTQNPTHRKEQCKFETIVFLQASQMIRAYRELLN